MSFTVICQSDVYNYDAQDLHSSSDFTDRVFIINNKKKKCELYTYEF